MAAVWQLNRIKTTRRGAEDNECQKSFAMIVSSRADLGGVEDGAGDDGDGGEDAGTSGHAGAAVHIAHLLRRLACHRGEGYSSFS